MPYVHCSNCHHEWETTNLKENCDWCKAPIGKVLEKETPLEKTDWRKILDNLNKRN